MTRTIKPLQPVRTRMNYLMPLFKLTNIETYSLDILQLTIPRFRIHRLICMKICMKQET